MPLQCQTVWLQNPNCLQLLSVDDTCRSYFKRKTSDWHDTVTDNRSGHDTIEKRHIIQTVTQRL